MGGKSNEAGRTGSVQRIWGQNGLCRKVPLYHKMLGPRHTKCPERHEQQCGPFYLGDRLGMAIAM